jgi:hypothetical protein
MTSPSMVTLNPIERRRIAGVSLVHERYVKKVYLSPEKCRPSTIERVRRAAVELGLPVPATTTTTTITTAATQGATR